MLDILNLIWDNFYWNYFNCNIFKYPALGCVGWIGFGLMGVVATILHYYTKRAYGIKYPPKEEVDMLWVFALSISLLFPGLYGLFLDISEYIIGGKLYWIFYEPLVKGFFYPAITSPIIFAIILLLRWLIKKIRLFLGLEKKYKY